MPLTFSGFSIWLKHKCRDRHKKHQNSPPNRSNASQTTIPTKSILQLRPRFLNIHLVPGDRPRSPLVHIIIFVGGSDSCVCWSKFDAKQQQHQQDSSYSSNVCQPSTVCQSTYNVLYSAKYSTFDSIEWDHVYASHSLNV